MDNFWKWLTTASDHKSVAAQRRQRVLDELRERQRKETHIAGYRHPSAPLRRLFR